MNMRTILLLLLLLLCSSVSPGQSQPTSDVSQHAMAEARDMMRKHAPIFIANRGQWPSQIRFGSRIQGLDMWVTNSSVLFDLHKNSAVEGSAQTSGPKNGKDHPEFVRRQGHILRMEFVGASPEANASGMHPQPGRYNFFMGNDPSRWAADVPLFSHTRINAIYPGVDALLFYDNGSPRYDLLLAAGADPSRIRIRYDGARTIRVTSSGELAIATSLGELTQQKLFAYQEIGGRQVPVACSFAVHDNATVGFALGSYDKSRPLVIDPVLYSTLLGGSGDENALAMALDAQQNVYVTGYANAPNPNAETFPTTTGAYDLVHRGNSDVFVSKLNPTLGALLYSTFIGGNGFDDGRSIAINGSGEAYVCGYTGSDNFPTTVGAYDRSYNGGSHDIFVTKLSASGSDLEYSTFIGGMASDGAYSIALESNGTARICGYTSSSDFPTTVGAYDRSYNDGADDIFSLALNPSGSDLASSTFIGGSGSDYAYAIKLDARGNGYIFGTTSSADLPVSPNAFASIYAGGPHDAVLLKLNASNSSLLYCSYYGGSDDDYAYDLALFGENDVALCGYTASRNFPTTPDSYSPDYNGGAYDIFAIRHTITSRSLTFSTFIGGQSDDYAYAIAIAQGNIWIAGHTASIDFPVFSAGYDTTYNGGPYDTYVLELDGYGDRLRYVSLFGGVNQDIAHDLIVIPTYPEPVNIYLCGTTNSANFPIGQGGYDATLARRFNDVGADFSYDAFVLRLNPRNLLLLTETPGNGTLSCQNGTFNINWASYGIDTIAIHLMSGTPPQWSVELISNYGADGGTWPWLVPSTFPSGTTWRIYITGRSGRDMAGKRESDTGAVFEVPESPILQKGIASMLVCPGEPLNFSIQATGYKISYLWRKDNFTIHGATASSFSIDSLTPRDTGWYEVAVIDACGNVGLSNKARVDFYPVPKIVQQPLWRVLPCYGKEARFEAIAEGENIRYQWYKNGTPIPGAVQNVLVIPSATEADTGVYRLGVFNDICQDYPQYSIPSRLELFPEDIETDPVTQHAFTGDAVSFSVVARGVDLKYQWRKDGVPIPGATQSTYIIFPVRMEHAGTYDVLINGECTMLSRPATLSVGLSSVAPGFGTSESNGLTITALPNPSAGRVVLQLASYTGKALPGNLRLELFNSIGVQVLDLTENLAASGFRTAEFDAAALPPGAYFCRLLSNDRQIASSIIMVSR